MKKMILSFVALCSLSLSTNVFAGGVKDLLIDAEDAIVSEFFANGLQVDSITNHSFTPVKGGIGVKAEVETINPTSRMGQSWTCVVAFEKKGSSYSAYDVDCK